MIFYKISHNLIKVNHLHNSRDIHKKNIEDHKIYIQIIITQNN
jgi:hypothetical protein